MLLVQLGINSTRDVCKFAKLDSPWRLVQFWQNFQTSLVLLIPNCTRHRMITYTYFYNICDTTFLIIFILTHPVNFPCGRKPERPEKPTTFGTALTDSFHMSP